MFPFENCNRATTECDLGRLGNSILTDRAPIRPRVHSDTYVTNTTGRRVVFASFKTNTREGIERIRRGRPLVPRSRRSAPREFHSLGVDSFLSWRFLPRNAHLKSNLVDSASSHTLVSKIKPCMSKYKRLYTVKLRTAH